MHQIAPYLPGLGLAYATFLIGIASPGPNVLAILGTSMAAGRRAGLALALGVATGSFVWAVLTVAGLSALIALYAGVLVAIKIGGGLYLIWLGIKAFRAAASRVGPADAAIGGDGSTLAFFRRGLTIQMTNPKAALAWIAIVSLGLQDGAPLWVDLALVLGTTGLSVVLHCLYAVMFSTPLVARLYRRARRAIQAMLGVVFCLAGLRLLTSRG